MSTYDRLANRLAGAWGSLQQPQDQHRAAGGWNASLAGSGDHPNLSPSSSGTTPKIYSPPSTGTGPVTPSDPLLPTMTTSGGPAPYTGPNPFGPSPYPPATGGTATGAPGGGGPADTTTSGGAPANNQSQGWTPTGPDWAPGNPGYIGAKNNPWGGGVSISGPPDTTLSQLEYSAAQGQAPYHPYTGPPASPSALAGGNPYVIDPSKPYSQANSAYDTGMSALGMSPGQTFSPSDFVNMLAQAGAYIAPDVMANPGILSGSGQVR